MNARSFEHVVIDRVRDYWNQRPCNLRHSPAPVGSRQYFDEVDARKYLVEPHILRFADHARWAGKRVLEIGCGLGTDTMRFARAGARVTAVDLSARSLEIARQRAEVYGVSDRVSFCEANAEELRDYVRPEPYDLVYSFGVIHHSPHPERVLRQIREHFVAPTTTVKLMVYHWQSWKVLSILMTEAHGAFWRLREAVARHSEAQTGCPVTYCYTQSEMRALLAAHRFAVDDLWVDHIFPYRVADYVKYRYVKAFPFSWIPQGAMSALERRMGWHLCATAHPA
jgi:2-polyprenyl-3-methyl-5-hydroxy-6-metoxy-1,4-benzoquinol methylase